MDKYKIIGEILLIPAGKDKFEIAEDLIIKVKDSSAGTIKFTLKKGFITDMGSIPRIVRGWFPHIGNKYLAVCYLLHDYLFATQGHLHSFSKQFVDDLLYDMMINLPTNVSSWKVSCIWFAVDKFGWGAWNDFTTNDYKAIDNNLIQVEWGI